MKQLGLIFVLLGGVFCFILSWVILLSGFFAVPTAGEDLALRKAVGLLGLVCSLLATIFGISLFQNYSKSKTVTISVLMVAVAITNGWIMTIPIIFFVIGVGLLIQCNKTSESTSVGAN